MYDRQVNNRTLTFCVSGQLWNRSLVMMDTQTQTLWSHLLGEAMRGQLKGSRLTALPADMVTWQAWRRRHPQTTVLDLSRTHRDFTKEFYRDPARFVVGFAGNTGMHHCSLATLAEQPVLNVDARGLPLLITFDPQSTSVRIFSRQLDQRTLTFTATPEGSLRDAQTGSTWDRSQGTASDGPLAGRQLAPHVGIISFARSWTTFHPESREEGGSRE